MPTLRFKHWLILIGILAFGATTKLPRLDTPPQFYFDEEHSPRTAIDYLHRNINVYEPFATREDDSKYEWSHPPIGKLVPMAAMALLGEKPIAWRIGSVLFGLALQAMVFLLAFRMTASSTAGFLASFLLAIEGLAFTQSRVGMPDIILTFFITAGIYFYLGWKEGRARTRNSVFVGACLGFAVATKWNGLILALVIGADLVYGHWIRSKLAPNHPARPLPVLQLALACTILPALIYVVSFAHYFSYGYSFKDFLVFQKELVKAHLTLKDPHPYDSSPWQWILDLRPTLLYQSEKGEAAIARIYNLGNPVILLTGAVAAVASLMKGQWRNGRTRVLLFAYFAAWTPWIFFGRVKFFHYYLPAIPFLVILLASQLHEALSSPERRRKRLAIAIVSLSTLWFALFYPHLSALPVPASVANKIYFALPSWR